MAGADGVRLVVFLLACYGATNIITSSKLLEGLRAWLQRRSRRLGYWVRCPMCVAVAVGAAWSLGGLRVSADLAWPVELVAAGAVSSGWCWSVHVVLARLGEDAL